MYTAKMFTSGFAFLVAGLVAAAPASAVIVPSTPAVFDSVGDTFSINFSQGYLGTEGAAVALPGLTSTAVFRLSALSGGDGVSNFTGWTFNIDDMKNTSSGIVTGSRLSVFGFDVDPNRNGTSATGVFSNVGSGQISNSTNVEVCFKSGGGGTGCAGGGHGGLSIGESIAVVNLVPNTFTLTFGSAQSQITLDKFVVRYQAIATSTGITDGSGIGTAAVPEPASWAMLIAGVGLVGGVMRRRRQTVALA
ncbi:MAG: cistern family PEP-CTERM protein [Polymorphobacter sp.]|uniref:cistern family PEP-CTERM protein n=1 Tax=Polymorphobacter sp. TaxID=1909290 RepID=UPI003A8ABA1B